MHEPRRELRNYTILDVFVTLILNDDGGELSIGRDSYGVRLSSKVSSAEDSSGLNVNNVKDPGRVGEIWRSVDTDKGVWAKNSSGGRLAANIDDSQSLGVTRISDVDESKRLLRTIGVEKSVTVFGSRDDLGYSLVVEVTGGVELKTGGEVGDAVEVHANGLSRWNDGTRFVVVASYGCDNDSNHCTDDNEHECNHKDVRVALIRCLAFFPLGGC